MSFDLYDKPDLPGYAMVPQRLTGDELREAEAAFDEDDGEEGEQVLTRKHYPRT